MRFYGDDFLGGTTGWTIAERGAYVLLLWANYRRGALPDDERALARLAGCSRKEFADIWPAIQEKFELGPEGWVNGRAQEERGKTLDRSAKARRAAEIRYANAVRTQCNPGRSAIQDQDQDQDQSQGQDQSQKSQPPQTPPSGGGSRKKSPGCDWKVILHEDFPALSESSRFVRAWEANDEMRREVPRRSRLSEQSTRSHFRKAIKAGPDRYAIAVEHSTENQYQGIKLEWVKAEVAAKDSPRSLEDLMEMAREHDRRKQK